MSSSLPLRRLLLQVLLVTVLLSTLMVPTVLSHEETKNEDKDEVMMKQLIDWVRQNGGVVSDKMEIRKVMYDDQSSYSFGVFAKEDILPHEIILQVPRTCYIDIFDQRHLDNRDEYYDDDEFIGDDDSFQVIRDNVCLLAHRLKKELKQHEQETKDKPSHYASYLDYLETQTPGQLPAMWSTAGKDVLRRLYGGPEVVDWMDEHYADCMPKDDNDKASFRHLLELAIQRGYESALIPIWDMFNHHNGLLNTENDSMFQEGGMQVRAYAQGIPANSEIFATYDKCLDCEQIADYWGTREILRDFGFVEDYPHRWVEPMEGIWFEIHNKDGTLQVVWDVEKYGDEGYGIPDREMIVGMKERLDSLRQAEKDYMQDQGNVPQKEWDILWQFYNATTSGLSLAIQAAQEALSESADEL